MANTFKSRFMKWQLWICSIIAIRWLRSSGYAAKKELIAIGGFILKAERRNIPDTKTGGTRMLSTFSLHKFELPDVLGPGPAWWYEKYELIPETKDYTILRYGKYPADWE